MAISTGSWKGYPGGSGTNDPDNDHSYFYNEDLYASSATSTEINLPNNTYSTIMALSHSVNPAQPRINMPTNPTTGSSITISDVSNTNPGTNVDNNPRILTSGGATQTVNGEEFALLTLALNQYTMNFIWTGVTQVGWVTDQNLAGLGRF